MKQNDTGAAWERTLWKLLAKKGYRPLRHPRGPLLEDLIIELPQYTVIIECKLHTKNASKGVEQVKRYAENYTNQGKEVRCLVWCAAGRWNTPIDLHNLPPYTEITSFRG